MPVDTLRRLGFLSFLQSLISDVDTGKGFPLPWLVPLLPSQGRPPWALALTK